MERSIRIILQISILFLFNYIGNTIQSFFGLTIPGSIIGMLLFFVLLLTHVIPEKLIKDGIDLLIKDMPLFFIPVTVGVIEFFGFLKGKGGFVLIIAFISTMLVIFTTSVISDRILGKEVDTND
jgi:holin-like protein